MLLNIVLCMYSLKTEWLRVVHIHVHVAIHTNIFVLKKSDSDQLWPLKKLHNIVAFWFQRRKANRCTCRICDTFNAFISHYKEKTIDVIDLHTVLLFLTILL